MNTLLSMLCLDDLAQAHGCGLKPELRAAIEAQARFPSVAASPVPQVPIDPAQLPENVAMLRPAPQDTGRKLA